MLVVRAITLAAISALASCSGSGESKSQSNPLTAGTPYNKARTILDRGTVTFIGNTGAGETLTIYQVDGKLVSVVDGRVDGVQAYR